jgi:hypothetical protein
MHNAGLGPPTWRSLVSCLDVAQGCSPQRIFYTTTGGALLASQCSCVTASQAA